MTTEESVLAELKTVKQQAYYLLDKYPSARNNDFALLWYYMKDIKRVKLPFLEQKVMDELNGKPESLRRVRQKIQNEEHRCLPNVDVRVNRKEREKAFNALINRV